MREAFRAADRQLQHLARSALARACDARDGAGSPMRCAHVGCTFRAQRGTPDETKLQIDHHPLSHADLVREFLTYESWQRPTAIADIAVDAWGQLCEPLRGRYMTFAWGRVCFRPLCQRHHQEATRAAQRSAQSSSTQHHVEGARPPRGPCPLCAQAHRGIKSFSACVYLRTLEACDGVVTTGDSLLRLSLIHI